MFKRIKELLFVAVIILLGGLITGCATTTDVSQAPPMSGEMYKNNIPENEKLNACVNIKLKINNNASTPSIDTVTQIINDTKKSNIFSSVKRSCLDEKEKNIKLNFNLDQSFDTNNGSNALKGFFIGFSLFLLTPVLPLSFDSSMKMNLEAIRWDGMKKEYSATTDASCSFVFGADVTKATNMLNSTLIDKNINSLMNQLSKDTEFFSKK